jgi:hypothetical protein
MDSPFDPNAPVAHGADAPDRSVRTRRAIPPLLITIAFLLALTTARNADIWAHLAAGRDIASGTISRPLSWLADLAAYLVYSLSGGTGLVVGKAGLFAATAAVLLGRRAPWRAVLGGFLAVLALGGALALNPTCVSYLFLAVAIGAIDRRSGTPEPGGWRNEIRTHRWLLVCFVLWANMDVWSLLGVAVVGARVVGRTLVRAGAAEPTDRGAWRLFALLVGTQLISPIPWNPALVAREFGNQFANPEAGVFPFRAALFSSVFQRELGGLVPFCAFWLLVCVGISSFVLAVRNSGTERQRAWERLFPLVGLFGAAALNVRFVPFFVVVCGATCAQNFRSLPTAQSLGARSRDRVERLRFGAQCLFGALAAIVLLAASWAGWLQALPAERRNWTLEPDPSLVRAAEQVEQWYGGGLLTADQETVFFAAEAEDTFAWFAPHSAAGRRVVERGPAGVARVRSAFLTPESAALDDPRIGCVVLCDPSRTAFTTALRNLTAPKSQWILAHLRGRVAVFVRPGTGPAARPVDLGARAFGLTSADRAEWTPEAFAVRPRWFDPFVVARPPRSIDRDEAVTYLLHEEATRDHRMVNGANRFLATQLAALAGSPPPGPAGWVTDPRVDMLTVAAGAVRPPSEAPPPIPFGRFAAFLVLTDVTADHYLAVRAARRGIAASPRDAACYEALGEAYLHLLSDPLEAPWSERAPALRRLRLTQAAAAFWQALALEPARAPSHLGLATVYYERQFLDLAIAEFRAYERFARVQGQQSTDAAERIRALERTVESARRTTEANAANLGALDRARLAARNGLTGQALDVLLQSDVSAFGAAGITLELDLLLSVGRVTEAREWLAPEHRKEIGAGAYDWFGIQSAAAIGDYAGAAAILLNQIVTSSKPDVLMSADELFGAVRIAAKEAFLFNRQSVPRMTLALMLSVVNRFADAGRQVALDYQARSEGYLLLALLALEEGDIGACDEYLNRLLSVWDGLAKAGIEHPAPHRTVALQMRALIRR